MEGDVRKLFTFLSPATSRRFGEIARCAECGCVFIVHSTEGGCRRCGSGSLKRY